MKKNKIIKGGIGLLLLYNILAAQVYLNLVNNPSFEERTFCDSTAPYGGSGCLFYDSLILSDCPVSLDGLCIAKHWFKPTGATSDYYCNCTSSMPSSVCVPNGDAGVPANVVGFQYAHTGNAYAGLATKTCPDIPEPTILCKNYREYIKNRMKAPLKKGNLYCVSMYVSLPDKISYASNNLGFYFSNDSIILMPTFPIGGLPVDSMVKWTNIVLDTVPVCYSHPEIITDKVNWVKIEAICSPPRGGERFITIGNFKDDDHTKDSCIETGIYQVYCSTNPWFSDPYYYIDDVSVVEVHPAKAAAQPSYTICPGQPIVLGTDTTEDAEYTWSPPTALSCIHCAHPVASPTTSITYVLQKKQCKVTTTDMVQIIVEQQASFLSIPKDPTKCPADTFAFTLNGPNTISLNCTPTDYLFHPAPNQWNFYPPQTTLYVFEQNWCNASKQYDTLHINVKSCENLEIPNVFTPNGDGVNDSWHVVWKEIPLGIKNFKVEIYDRWGLKVYESEQWNFEWDGKHCRNVKSELLEEECTTGTYYYIIRYDWNEKPREWKGYVTLLR